MLEQYNDDQLSRIASKLDSLQSNASLYSEYDINNDQQRLIDRYYNESMPGDEDEEMDYRSKAQTREVAETVDWMMPDILKVFTTSKFVEFRTDKPEDKQDAKIITAYMNHVFMKHNPGFEVIYDVAKDGLLRKIGVIQATWDEQGEEEYYNLDNFSDEDIGIILSEVPNSRIVKLGDYNETGTRKVTVAVSQGPKLRIKAIDPDCFLVTEGASSVDEAPYVATCQKVTRSDLKNDGYPEDVVDELSDGDSKPFTLNTHSTSRKQHQEIFDGVDEASEELWLFDEYAKLDIDDDGIQEYVHCLRVGNTILSMEYTSGHMIEVFTPNRIPHEIIGRAIAEDVVDIQEQKTVMLRGILDNMAMVLDPQFEVNENAVSEDTIDDLINWRPRGIVRALSTGSVQPLTVPDISRNAMNVMTFLDGEKEKRTGISRFSMGLDADALNTSGNNGISSQIVQENNQGRKELIVRLLAECLGRLMYKMYRLLLIKQPEAQIMEITGKQMEINPSAWARTLRYEAVVGLGTNSKIQQEAAAGKVVAAQERLAPLGMVTPGQMYNAYYEYIEALGVGDPDLFIQPAPPASEEEGQEEPPIDPIKIAELEMKERLETAKLTQQKELEEKKLLQERELEEKRLLLKREEIMAELALKREAKKEGRSVSTNIGIN